MSTVVRYHRQLLGEFDGLPDEMQRAAIRRLTHRAFEFACLSERPRVQTASDLLDTGLPRPPPFTDIDSACAAPFADEYPAGEEVFGFVTTKRLQPCLIHRPSTALPTISRPSVRICSTLDQCVQHRNSDF